MHAKLTEDTKYLQRLLTFAGYPCGQIDGIRGRKTNSAAYLWLMDEERYRREFGTFDTRTEDNLTTLIPSVQRAVRQWLSDKVMAWAEKEGIVVKVICGTRTFLEQDRLYQQGRTTKGAKVTNAKAGSSYHNYGVAMDLGLFTKDGKYLTSDEPYKALYDACKAPDGMVWGGNWKSLVDTPHYQTEKYKTIAALKKEFLG